MLGRTSGNQRAVINFNHLLRHASPSRISSLMSIFIDPRTSGANVLLRDAGIISNVGNGMPCQEEHITTPLYAAMTHTTFSRLTTVDLHVTTSFGKFDAPLLENLTLRCLHVYETSLDTISTLVPAWRLGPSFSDAFLRLLLRDQPHLLVIALLGINFTSDTMHASQRHTTQRTLTSLPICEKLKVCTLRARSPEAILIAKKCISTTTPSPVRSITRVSYNSRLPEWCFTESGLA